MHLPALQPPCLRVHAPPRTPAPLSALIRIYSHISHTANKRQTDDSASGGPRKLRATGHVTWILSSDWVGGGILGSHWVKDVA